MKNERPEWAAKVVHQMYQHRIRNKDLAEATHYSERYTSMILSGAAYSERAKVAILAALDRMIAEKNRK